MAELTAILDDQEMTVRLDGQALRIDRPGCKPERIPLGMLKKVIVIGRPMVACDVWRALAGLGILAILLPARGRGEAAFAGAGLTARVEPRLEQYKAANDKAQAARIARWLLKEKCAGQVKVLLGFNGRNKNTIMSQVEQIGRASGRLDECHGRDAMMGVEGAATAAYFQALAMILPAKWNFSGRNRRPPLDPINALFSYCYSLATGEIIHSLLGRNLDPALGVHHAVLSGRYSLALDVLEPIRPRLDEFALAMLETPLTLRDFSTGIQEGCLLNKAGRAKFFQLWCPQVKQSWRESTAYFGIQQVIDRLLTMLQNN